jgi:hypothetical protein
MAQINSHQNPTRYEGFSGESFAGLVATEESIERMWMHRFARAAVQTRRSAGLPLESARMREARAFAARFATAAARYSPRLIPRRELLAGFKDELHLSHAIRAIGEHALELAQIKAWRAAGESYGVIAARLDGIDGRNESWQRSHRGVTADDVLVIETMGTKRPRPERHRDDLRAEVRRRHEAGETQQALADAFGVNQGTISRWLNT